MNELKGFLIFGCYYGAYLLLSRQVTCAGNRCFWPAAQINVNRVKFLFIFEVLKIVQ